MTAIPQGHRPATAYPAPVFAPWGTRVASALVDGLIPAAIAVVGVVVALALREYVVVGVVCWVGAFGFALWNSGHRQGRTGQSLGKRLVGTRLLRAADGRPLGFGPALVRQFAHILDTLPLYAGWFRPLWDAQRRTFADSVCGSVVVRVG